MLPTAVRDLFSHATDLVTPWLESIRRRVGPAWSVLTPAGRAVLMLTAVAWLLAWRLGWQELAVCAGVGVVLLVLTGLFLIGRTRLAVALDVQPPRVVVGESVTGSLAVTNTSRAPMLPVVLELPVGAGGVAFEVPPLRSGSEHTELFVVPTERRGVIDVGPATSVRGDPVGLFRRDQAWTGVTEIFVHPRVTALDPLGAGLIRDLEGAASERVSMSDLAFHALREYAPGDDLRHVHWRSSARHGALLVRQFLDTRRSHLNVIVDCDADAYRSEDDYETAISVAASLLVRAVLDQHDASFMSGSHAMTRGNGRSALDACSRATPGPESLVSVAAASSRLAPDSSVVFLVTGPHTDFLTLQRAASQFSVEVGKVAVRVDGEADAALRSTGELPLLVLGRLESLPGLLRWGLS